MGIKRNIFSNYLDYHQIHKNFDEIIEPKILNSWLNNFKEIQINGFYSLPIFFIIDYANKEYLLLTNSVQSILGYHPKEFMESNLDKLLHIFKKEDFKIFNTELFPRNISYIEKQPIEEHSQFIFSYNFRVKSKQKKEVNILQHSMYISSPKTGAPLFSIGLCSDISNYKNDGSIIHTIEKVDAVSKRKNLIEQNFFYPNEDDAILSDREKEILKWITEGLNSKQIAQKLYLSENTVSNHRQNMLKKLNAKNVAELIVLAINKKII